MGVPGGDCRFAPGGALKLLGFQEAVEVRGILWWCAVLGWDSGLLGSVGRVLRPVRWKVEARGIALLGYVAAVGLQIDE